MKTALDFLFQIIYFVIKTIWVISFGAVLFSFFPGCGVPILMAIFGGIALIDNDIIPEQAITYVFLFKLYCVVILITIIGFIIQNKTGEDWLN